MTFQTPVNRFLFIALFASGLLLGCTKTPMGPPPPTGTTGTIAQVLASVSNTTIYNGILTHTGLDTTLSGPGPFTVFVATDTAFTLAGFTVANLSILPDSILYHLITYSIIDGLKLGAATLPAGPDAKIVTAGGDSIYVSNNSSGIFVNGVPVTETDVTASNGIINTVMSPLIPAFGSLLQTLSADTVFSFMTAAIARASQGATNLDTILSTSPFTIFVPSNSAFQTAGFATINDINTANPDSLARLVEEHIVPKRIFSSDFNLSNGVVALSGSSLNILGGQIPGIKGNSNFGFIGFVSTNIMASNGVIHIISGMLTQ
jgi:uncharacterized surface protein with fasciclin (FAS1) repeats